MIGQSQLKPHQSHLQATYKPSAWEGVGTYKPPTCDLQATLMRPPSHLQCDPKTTRKGRQKAEGRMKKPGLQQLCVALLVTTIHRALDTGG